MLNKIKNISKKTLRSQKEDSQYLVALDIGTEFVKVLIARVGKDNTEIIGVGRAHQSLSDMQAGAISDITSVVENCDKALGEAERQAGLSVRSAVIGIAGELVKGTTITVKVKRNNPTKPIDVDEIEKIIRLVQQKAQDKAKQQLSWELGGKDIEVRLVNSALVGIDIDGYPVTNPVGFQGKDVVIQLFAAFAPMIHIGAIERTAQQLDLDLLAVAAEPFAVSRSVIGDDPNASMSAILMDVGGGTTDIAVINDGGVQGTKMFGIGGRAYTKAVEKELAVDFIEAEKLKLGLATNQTPSQKIPSVETALKKTLDVWISGVELALSEFPKLDHLPNRIFLCGGGSSLELLMEELEKTKWYRQLPFTKQPTVQYIKPSQVVGIVDKTGQVNDHTYITALGLIRVGLDTLAQTNNTETSSIRERLDRILRT